MTDPRHLEDLLRETRVLSTVPPPSWNAKEQGGSDVSGEPGPHLPSLRSDRRAIVLGDVHAAADELLLLDGNYDALDVTLAAAVANYAPGDPVWAVLVGPPGCGKSEQISALVSAPNIWPLSSLTPQTLLSGFERPGMKQPASLLKQIGPFGIIVMKDLTTVLTMPREARAAIIGQLRETADGRTEKQFGNGVRVAWEGKLGLVAGVTPVIDEQQQLLAVMGERFVLFRMARQDRRALARRALSRRGCEEELRRDLREITARFLEQFVECGRLWFPEEYHEPLIELTDIVTRARSGVSRDGYSRELLYLPEPEAPTRLGKQLAQLGAGLLAIGVTPAEMWKLISKAGWDSVPAVRCAILAEVATAGGRVDLATLQERTALPAKTVERVVEDLAVLHLVTRHKPAGKWLVEATEATRDYWAATATPDRLGNSGLGSSPEKSDPPESPLDLGRLPLREIHRRHESGEV